jgi:hypothetical protein
LGGQENKWTKALHEEFATNGKPQHPVGGQEQQHPRHREAEFCFDD